MSNKIKLLLISGPLNAGGAEKVLLDIICNIDKEKYDVDLALIINQGKLLSDIPSHINVIPLWETYSLGFRLGLKLSTILGYNGVLRRQLKCKIVDYYDITISCLEGLPLKIHSLLEGKGKNWSWVHTDLDKFRYTAKLFKNEEEAYHKLDKILTVSEGAKEALLKRFKTLSSDKITTLHNPIDIKKVVILAGETKSYEQFQISIVGRLTTPKRLDKAINVMAMLKKNNYDCMLNIVGTGELEAELKQLVNNLQLNDSVNFVGYQANPYSWIKNSDVLLSTSDYEGFGLVIVEAMALGIPVIATKTVGATEIIGDNLYGILCENNVEAIFNAVKTFFDNKELRESLSGKGIVRSKDFEISNTLIKFDEIISNQLQ